MRLSNTPATDDGHGSRAQGGRRVLQILVAARMVGPLLVLATGLVAAVERGLVGADDRIVVLNTGSGLKDVASALKAVETAGTTPLHVTPDLAALEAALKTSDPEH